MTQATATKPTEAPVSPWQARVLQVPEEFDLALLGGRGPGKSYALALLILRHLEQYGDDAKILYIRRSYPALRDFEEVLRDIFFSAYGRAARYSAQSHVWNLTAGMLELGQLESVSDLDKYQGRSLTLLIVDEIGQFPDFSLVDRLRSNLRTPVSGMPTRMIVAGNPGGVGHHLAAERYVLGKPKWKPFYEAHSGKKWVLAHGVYTDNPFIDHDAYRAQLEAAAKGDKELALAWIDGRWDIARGAFFSGVLEQSRSMIEAWPYPQSNRYLGWRYHLALDHGSTAPGVALVLAFSPGIEGPDGRWYPPGSIVVLDELATDTAEDLNTGLGLTISETSERIHDLVSPWNIPARGVGDDACFARHGHDEGSIADQYRKHGVHLRPAKKGGRVAGWENLKTLMKQAGEPDVPGLYISDRCRYLWQTLPILARDPKRPEDMDTRGPDHGADALRYGALSKPQTFRIEPLQIGLSSF